LAGVFGGHRHVDHRSGAPTLAGPSARRGARQPCERGDVSAEERSGAEFSFGRAKRQPGQRLPLPRYRAARPSRAPFSPHTGRNRAFDDRPATDTLDSPLKGDQCTTPIARRHGRAAAVHGSQPPGPFFRGGSWRRAISSARVRQRLTASASLMYLRFSRVRVSARRAAARFGTSGRARSPWR
jgi:hypothetical protein